TEVDGGLCLAGADENAAITGLEREDVPWLDQVVRLRLRACQHPDRACPVGRADPRGHTLARIDAHRECCPEPRLIARDHLRQIELLQTFGGHGYAYDAARIFADERDVLGARQLGSHREVALVLPILV